MLATIHFRISAFHFCYLNVKMKIQRHVTFPLTLSGFETWPLILKEGIGLRIYYKKNQQDETLAVLFISHCKITLQVSDAFCVHHQEYKNCSSSHWCMS